ncbi:MAG TPA: isoprenylcysteine carboxylmethyltransferase family protein [Terracidiphilus sp.]|nr:isoprenylcysteine carboxylmethyltransferase family protein [Terracidiphilus sp.]
MSFQATEAEFENRFWIIGGVFSAGFALYGLDHVNAAEALTRLIVRPAGMDSPRADSVIRAIFGAAALTVTAAALLRCWAEAYLKSSVVHDSALHSESLVADGPYRYVRNPLYLGNILLAAGMGTMASSVGFFFILIGMTLVVYRLILREEAGLGESQGAGFLRYCEAVPRLLPSLRPRVPAGGTRPNWVDGIAGETFMWGCAIGIAVFAVSLQVIHFWIVISAGFAVYFLQSFWRGRKRGQ